MIFLKFHNIIKCTFLANLEGSKIDQNLSPLTQDILKSTPIVEKPFVKVRSMPGDKLSKRKFKFCC